AARYSDTDDLRSLASYGVSLDSLDSQGRTVTYVGVLTLILVYSDTQIKEFEICIWLRRITVVEYLISEGVDINALNDENNAPLHWACLNGHVEKLENCRCERTPMDEAIGAEKMEIIDAINTTVAQMELENTRVTRLFQTSPSRHRKC
ncbi:predicted protein, partial [Arabidopsis lyrata subsp. lyrata]